MPTGKLGPCQAEGDLGSKVELRAGEGPEGVWLLWVNWVGKQLPACLWNGPRSRWKGGRLQLLRWGKGKQMRLLIDPEIQGSLQPPQAQWPVVLILRSTCYQISVYLKQHHLADGVAEPVEYVIREFLSHLLSTFLFLLLPLAVVCSLLCNSWCPGLCQSFGKWGGSSGRHNFGIKDAYLSAGSEGNRTLAWSLCAAGSL